MRISNVKKSVKSMVAVFLMAFSVISLAGCSANNALEANEKYNLTIDVENAMKIDEQNEYLLDIKGVPEEATKENTYIMPDARRAMVTVKEKENKEINLAEIKVAGEKVEVIEEDSKILVKGLTTTTEVKLKDKTTVIQVNKLELKADNMESNTIYLIRRPVEGLPTKSAVKEDLETTKTDDAKETTDTASKEKQSEEEVEVVKE
ncbi:MAG: hypothetical protein RR702_04090 [Clostridia bacterium]